MERLILLGPPRLLRDGRQPLPLLPERRLQLLCVLGCETAKVSRERMAELLWPGRAPAVARSNLRKVLHDLRPLGVQSCDEGPEGLCWTGGSDLADFAAACAQQRWVEAARGGAGVLLQDFDLGRDRGDAFTQWLREQREAHARRWRQAMQQALAGAGAADALALSGLRLAADPLDDEALAIYADAAAALGRPALADVAHQQRAERLRGELGLDAPAPPPPASLALEPPSPLVGRRAEVAVLEAALAGERLVVLLGPGGVGKTRLARHLAARAAPRHARGAVVVLLDDARAPSDLPARVAAALGLRLPGHGPAFGELARLLEPRPQLLVLDGFEAVIDAAAELPRLLAAAPRLQLLVTSRERLPLAFGSQHVLAPLAHPPAGAAAADWLGCDAVQLFAARARIVRPGFEAAAELDAVASVCRATGGLPLALELAAAWLRALAPRELARELSSEPGLLAAPDGGTPGLQAVFERSWALLTAGERRAYARLSVFRGSFTRGAAQAVAAAELPLLAALLDKSMLAVDSRGRFALHPLLARFAAAQLGDGPEAAATAAAHARHHLGLLAAAGPPEVADHDNSLAAWRHALAARDLAALQAALPGLARLFAAQGRLAEARRVLDDSAAACRRGGGALPALLQAHCAWMLLWSGEPRTAVRVARQAARALARQGHAGGHAMALRTLGHAARLEGRLADSEALFRAAIAAAREARDAPLVAMLRDALAMTLNLRGRHGQARRELAAALRHNAASGDAVQRMYNLFNRAHGHALGGETAAALPWAQQAAALAETLGYAAFGHHAQALLAELLARAGRAADAAPRAQAALRAARITGDASALVRTLEVTARVELASARPGAAMAALAEAAALARERDLRGPAVTALLPVAASAIAPLDPAAARRWLHALHALGSLPATWRREASALWRRLPSARPLPARPRPLAAVLGDIASSCETLAKRLPD